MSTETVTFTAARRQPVVMDFKAPEGSILGIGANGRDIKPAWADEHIVIPRRFIRKGENLITIGFLAGHQSINLRDEFLYTLLVPDRARTLFPCFDQPDIKARFSLSLDIPEGWTAVANAPLCKEETTDGKHTLHFGDSAQLSTYLFSFVAGKFERLEATRAGRTISMYHRETDPQRIAQAPVITDLVFDSLEWMEEYLGCPYPFDKYDFIVLPDFQYGGMEHAGATLYNDKRIFLGSKPTTDELLNRASLIAHETAHMWFGDWVTMKWFDDVWTKEVFANWFAAQIMRPIFPEVNHSLSDLKNYYAPAYAEDRTPGANAIQRPLDNLQDAGLIYCNTIYDKAPVVMDKLARKMGYERFREGMQEYVRQYGGGNATWDDLIAILDKHSDKDIKAWSDVWVKEAGMPEYTAEVDAGGLHLRQDDPTGKSLVWEQEFDNRTALDRFWIPNTDGLGYGWFHPDDGSLEYIMENWGSYDDIARMSLLMTLYETSRRDAMDTRRFVEWCSEEIGTESNPLVLSSLISYASGENDRLTEGCRTFFHTLRGLASDARRSHELRLLAFRQYFKAAGSPGEWDEVYRIWKERSPFPGLVLNENDYTSMAYQLMIAMPEKAGEICLEQRSRISNPDRLAAFDFISRAASPDSASRKELFNFLLAAPENRRPESRVLTALGLLCHSSRRAEAMEYIVPSLEALPEIQRTGDIFFPASWCRTLLGNQHTPEAQAVVDGFLDSHPELNPLLVTKILQAR